MLRQDKRGRWHHENGRIASRHAVREWLKTQEKEITPSPPHVSEREVQSLTEVPERALRNFYNSNAYMPDEGFKIFWLAHQRWPIDTSELIQWERAQRPKALIGEMMIFGLFMTVAITALTIASYLGIQ